jgi:general secretion pathway protein G
MLKFRKRISGEKGFTLVEVMIVVIILAILGGIALVSFGGLDKQAKDARVQADMRAIATALKGYKAMTGAFPTSAEGLTILTTTTAGPPSFTALIDSIPNDTYAAAPYTYVGCDIDPA